MTPPSHSTLLDVATEAVRAAGAHATTQGHRRAETLQAFDHDVKLVLDRECQDVIEAVIHRHFPTHPILGEEGSIAGSTGQPEWIVDPIDGTVNFSHGMPMWCHSVAVRIGSDVVAGAVYVPPLGELYAATLEGPACCNGEAIAPSSCPDLRRAMVLTGLSKTIASGSSSFEALRTLVLSVQKVRIMGAAAVDICHVARGRAEGYVEVGIHLWDIAAARLIAERAGARAEVLATYPDGRMRFICTTRPLFEPIKDLFNQTPESAP